MGEVDQEQAQTAAGEASGEQIERATSQAPKDGAPKDGKGGLVAAGVTAAVLGGAAVAVGVARSREAQAWARLQEQALTGAATRTEAGSLERLFPEITVPQMLRRTVDRFADRPALVQRIDKEWVPTTYGHLWERVANFALGLDELGAG